MWRWRLMCRCDWWWCPRVVLCWGAHALSCNILVAVDRHKTLSRGHGKHVSR